MMRPVPGERHRSGYTEKEMKDLLPSPDLEEHFIDVVMALNGDDSRPKVDQKLGTRTVRAIL